MFVTANEQIVNHSCKVLAEGGARFGESLKRKRQAIVRITTDDCQLDLAVLLRQDEKNQIRVGTCVDGRRMKWQVLAIARNRIRSMEVVG